LPYNDYFEYFGPHYRLHIDPSNATNENTPEFLKKIQEGVIENLRHLPHVPSVQMQPIGDESYASRLLKEEEEARDNADPDVRFDRVIENLRHLPHVPSVQMQPIGDESYASRLLKEEEEARDNADPDVRFDRIIPRKFDMN
ncbi:unnamed protein product, partial [Gongylonema pulchrum]|uniref:Histone deacetylase n=1 Tax=Gongylonema pulchrum TaxID=637853 RepID=A0A183EML7_9BILA